MDGKGREGGRDEPCSCVICSLLCDLKATAPRVPPPAPPRRVSPRFYGNSPLPERRSRLKKTNQPGFGVPPRLRSPAGRVCPVPGGPGLLAPRNPGGGGGGGRERGGAGAAPRCSHPVLGVPPVL